METDLEAVIKDKRLHLGLADIKSYMQMTLRAVRPCLPQQTLSQGCFPGVISENAGPAASTPQRRGPWAAFLRLVWQCALALCCS